MWLAGLLSSILEIPGPYFNYERFLSQLFPFTHPELSNTSSGLHLESKSAALLRGLLRPRNAAR